MKKRTKTMLFSASAALITLLAVVAVIFLIPSGTGDGGSSNTIVYNIIAEDKANLQSIHISNTESDFVIKALGNDKYEIEQIKDYPMDNSAFLMATGGISNLYSRYKIENPESLSEYGLDVPKSICKVSYSNGNEYTLHIGKIAPFSAANGYYAKLENDNNVYVIDTDTGYYLTANYMQYVRRILFSETSAEFVKRINKIEFYGKNVTAMTMSPTKVSYDGINYADILKIDAPYEVNLIDEKQEALVSSVCNVYTNEAVCIGPTAAQLREYGFDDPTAAYKMTYDGDKTVEIKLGNKVGAEYYIMSTEYDVVYKIAVDSVDIWSNIKPKDVMSTLVITPYIYETKSLTVETLNEKYVFDIVGDVNDTSYLKVSKNGEEIDSANFKKFYTSALGFNANDVTTGSVAGKECVLKLTYTYKDTSRTPDVMEFYNLGERRYQAVKNGKSSFIAQSKKIDTILTNLDKLLRGEKITLEYDV